MVRAAAVLVLGLSSAVAHAAEPAVCRAYAVVGQQLKQHLNQGQTVEQAVDSVLDLTASDPAQREEARPFVATTATIVNMLPLRIDTTADFLLLSCMDGGLLDGAAAQASYLQNLPRYLEAAINCEKQPGDGNALQLCMVKAFTLPASGQ